MALGETYISLQQGVVDAQENPIPPSTSRNSTRWPRTFRSRTTSMPHPAVDRGKALAGPRSRRQAAVIKAAQEASAWHRKAVVSEDDKMLADMTAKGATVIKPDVPAFGRASKSVYDKAGEQFPKPVLEALLKDTDVIKAKYPVR